MSVSSITVRLKQVLENRRQADLLKEEIFKINRYEEWIAQFYLLADTQYHGFCENKRILESVFKDFENGDAPEHMYEELSDCLRLLLSGDTVDPGLAQEALNILIPHYEMKHNIEKLIYLYECAGFTYLELSRTGDADFGEISVQYYEKIISFKEDEKIVSQMKNVLRIVLAYYNLLAPSVSVSNISFKAAYEHWKEFRVFVERSYIRELIKNHEDLKSYVKMTMDVFPKSAFLLFHESKCDEPDIYPTLIEIAKHYYFDGGISNEEIEDPLSDDFYTYHCLCVETEVESPEKAFWAMEKFYSENAFDNDELSLVKATKNSIGIMINPLIRIMFVLNKTGLPHHEKYRLVKKYSQEILKVVAQLNKMNQSYTINTAVNDVVTNEVLFQYIESPQERADFLLRLTTLRQLSTMIHSNMVAELVETILSAIYKWKPELLLHTANMNSVQEIMENKSRFMQFAKNAAMMHDIGKNAMIDIINTNYRPLTDAEAMIIKNHPKRGCDYLKVNPDFEKFHDIVLGHHKFYNGTGGYDNSFDNTKSKYRFLIDLVTICDCMDAATDYLGRNFRSSKTVDTLFGELKDKAGTLYNPDIIQFIGEHPDLYQDLKRTLGPGRTEIYYKIYQKFF